MPDLLALTPNLTCDIILAVPDLTPGEVHRATGVAKIPGGKGVNVARITRTLAYQVEIGGFLAGYNGRYCEHSYTADGLRGHYVWYEGETRDSILINEPDGRSTVINEDGSPVGEESVLELARHIHDVIGQFKWLSSSGSVPPGAPMEAYMQLIEASRPAKIAIDSHGRMLAAAAHQGLDLLRINHLEASDLLGRNIDTVEQAAEACAILHDWGNRHVAISLGEPGAVGYDGVDCWHVNPPAVTVISNVGAGDAMFAGMITAFMAGKSFAEALRQGVACGSANCTVREPAGLPLDTYDRLLPQVAMERL